MTPIIAIDPGPVKSALIVWNGKHVQLSRFDENQGILDLLLSWAPSASSTLAIEQIASYGMPVGAEVFETAFWTGRFAEAYGADHVIRIPRLRVKLRICHDSRAKDGNVRQALIDRFGGKDSAIGRKAAPGPLYGISGDLWAALALAVAVTAQEIGRGDGNEEEALGGVATLV